MKMWKFLSLLLTLIIITSFQVNGGLSGIIPNNVLACKMSGMAFSGYVDHPSIAIGNSSQLLSQAIDEGWDGDGTPSDPIIIDGLRITGSGDLIAIGHTNLHFKITNSNLIGGTTGIYFINVSNGQVVNTVINGSNYQSSLNERYGIRMYGSDNCSVTETNVSSYDYGIELEYSNNTTIDGSIVFDNHYGIYFHGSSQNMISDSEVFDNTLHGITLTTRSSYNSIVNNKIHHNSFKGIWIK
ncbi:MAG: right-handed parallel beta-helix repeat-containing protein, partial [Candidatus Odinarchaeota archaeon]